MPRGSRYILDTLIWVVTLVQGKTRVGRAQIHPASCFGGLSCVVCIEIAGFGATHVLIVREKDGTIYVDSTILCMNRESILTWYPVGDSTHMRWSADGVKCMCAVVGCK